MGKTEIEWAGQCQCGCGCAAPVASRTYKERGWIKGKPIKFIHGHNGKLRLSGIISFIVDSDGCWVWQRSKTGIGYGHLTVNNNQVLAHRFVYEKLVMKIPDGLTLDHLCRNTLCVNPEHLEPVPHAENCRRGVRAKLTMEDAVKIREHHKGGASISTMAKYYGVDRRTIRGVIKNETWV